MKFILPLFFTCLSISVNAATDLCPSLNCDCENIPESTWQKECRDYEKGLRKACVANNGKPTGYCHLHGPDARPLAQGLKYKTFDVLAKDSIKAHNKKIEILAWSAKDDFKVAGILEKRKRFKDALSYLKKFEKTQKNIHNIRRQIAQSWIALEDPDEATGVWEDARDEENTLMAGQLEQAESLWKYGQSPEVKQTDKRIVQLVAIRRLKNLGDYHERNGDIFERAGEPVKAAGYWQQSAAVAELLAKWKQKSQAKATHIRFYMHQAASRWYSAANCWLLADKQEQAAFSRSEAERLLSGII